MRLAFRRTLDRSVPAPSRDRRRRWQPGFDRLENKVLLSGSIVAWGGNSSGQLNVPAGSDYTAIANGVGFGLALRSDGSLVAWGDNTFGELDVPTGTGYTAIAAGNYFGMALRSDGSIVAWGNNASGELNVPAGTGYTAISGEGGYGLALRADGSIAAWGGTAYSPESDPVGNEPAGTGFTAISAGPGGTALALASDGSVVSWGNTLAVPAGTGYTAIAAGSDFGVALSSDGSIVGFGEDFEGDTQVPAGTGYSAISAGTYCGAALTSDGSIVEWGDDSELPSGPVPPGTGYTAISMGGAFGLALEAAPKAMPTITWANPPSIVYGTALGAAQLDATANVPGTFVYSPSAGTTLGARPSQTLSVIFTPDDTADYETVTATATIDVLEATPTITWANPADIAYGTPLGSAQLDATADVPGTFLYSPPAGTVLSLGPAQVLNASFVPTDSADYTNASLTVTINVTAAAPAVSTVAATAVRATGATLNASVNPEQSATSISFVYGTDPQLAGHTTITSAQSVGAGSTSAPATAVLTGLQPNTTYYFRALATNAGGTTDGTILSFTTVASGLTITGTNPATGSAVASLPNGQVTINFSAPLAGLTSGGPALSARDPFAIFLLQRGPDGVFTAASGVDRGDLPLHANTLYRVNGDGTSSITITPLEPLSTDVYGISIALSAFTDQAGDPLVDPTGLNGFRTFLVQPPPPTSAALSVQRVSTYNGYTTVAGSAIFQPDTFGITFNKPHWEGSATAANFRILAAPSYSVVPSVAAYSPSTDTVYLTPTAALVPGTVYVIAVSGAVSDDQGFGAADTRPGGTLGAPFYDSFTVLNPSVSSNASAVNVVGAANNRPETLPGNGLLWPLPLGYASVGFTEPLNLSPSVFGRFSAMLDPRLAGSDGNSALTNVPVNAALAFNPNTNQLIIVPTQATADGLSVLALAGMQSLSGAPLTNPDGKIAGVTGAPFYATFEIQTSPAAAIPRSTVSATSTVATIGPIAPATSSTSSAASATGNPAGSSAVVTAAHPMRPAQAAPAPKGLSGLAVRTPRRLARGAARRPAGPLAIPWDSNVPRVQLS